MPNKKSLAKKPSSQDDIMSLAHAGTKEALAKLEDIVANGKNEDKKAMAELALDECRLFYYEPTNEQEENDYYLLKLIRQKDNRLIDFYAQLSGLECEVKFAEQEVRVAKAIAEQAKKEEKEDKKIAIWVMQDLLTTAEHRLEELQEWIKDDEAFIETARGLITTERYKKLPEDYMDQVHFDNEALEDLFDDLDDDDCDCCRCEDCDYRGPCSEFEEDSSDDDVSF